MVNFDDIDTGERLRELISRFIREQNEKIGKGQRSGGWNQSKVGELLGYQGNPQTAIQNLFSRGDGISIRLLKSTLNKLGYTLNDFYECHSYMDLDEARISMMEKRMKALEDALNNMSPPGGGLIDK